MSEPAPQRPVGRGDRAAIVISALVAASLVTALMLLALFRIILQWPAAEDGAGRPDWVPRVIGSRGARVEDGQCGQIYAGHWHRVECPVTDVNPETCKRVECPAVMEPHQ